MIVRAADVASLQLSLQHDRVLRHCRNALRSLIPQPLTTLVATPVINRNP